jgi:hypothetical protein
MREDHDLIIASRQVRDDQTVTAAGEVGAEQPADVRTRAAVAIAFQTAADHSEKIGVPLSRVNSRKRVIVRFVISPGLPFPITRPSTLIIGMTSAAVPVRKASSAM